MNTGNSYRLESVSDRAVMQSKDETPPPHKMPASTPGEPQRKAQKPPKPRKVEKRQRGRKG